MQSTRKLWRLTKALFEIWEPILKPVCLFVCLFLFIPTILVRILLSRPVADPLEQIDALHTQVITNTLPAREVKYWSTKGHVDDLRITNENLIALSIIFKGHKLVVLNIQTSDFFWRDTPNMSSLDVDQKRVYVGRINDVQAYDLTTGEKIWDYKQPSKGRGSMYVFAEGDKIKVYDDSLSSRFISATLTLDAKTGKLLNTDNTSELLWPPNYDLIYRTAINSDIEYRIKSDGRIVAIDIQTGKEVGYLEMSNPSNYDKIAASDDFLAVYNDNNRELIIFKRKN